MLGKVPNKANSPKRTAIRVGVVLIVVCALMALSSYHKLTTDGGRWSPPREVLDRVDFEQITRHFDDMMADGFIDMSHNAHLAYWLSKSDDGYAAPYIEVYWVDGAKLEDRVTCRASTRLVRDAERIGESRGNRFRQDLLLENCAARIEIRCYTPDLFGGRQLVTDYLSDFCDRYCAD